MRRKKNSLLESKLSSREMSLMEWKPLAKRYESSVWSVSSLGYDA